MNLSDSEIDSGPDLLSDLADNFSQQLRCGEQPTIEQYAESHPELAAEIRKLFPA